MTVLDVLNTIPALWVCGMKGRTAFAGEQIAVRIASELRLGHNVVQAASLGRKLTQAIKATATLSCVDGLAKGLRLQEVCILEVGDPGRAGRRDAEADAIRYIGAGGAELVWHKYLDHVARFAAVEQAQNATRDEAIYGRADRAGGEVNAASEPIHRKAEAGLALQAAMAQEMPINDAVGDGKPQARDEIIFDLLPHEFSIGFFVFHGRILRNFTVPTGSGSSIDS
jgi:hypothetical protein